MLGKADATPMIAVKDIDRAKQFYEETLGLTSQDVGVSDVFMLKSGDTELSVYKSEFAGTASFRDVMTLARAANSDPSREELIRLLETARALSGEAPPATGGD